MSDDEVPHPAMEELVRRRSSLSLKKTETKIGGSHSPEELAKLSKMWDSEKLETLAEKLGISVTLVNETPPQDGMEFAKNVFEGLYTQDVTEATKAALRENLRRELRRKSTSLKHTTTQLTEGPLDKDVEAAAKVYEEKEGDLKALSALYGVSLSLMESNPPCDAEMFATDLLSGMYTPDGIEMVKFELRDQLKRSLIRKKGKLRHSVTTEYTGEAHEDDVKMLAQAYDEKNSLEELAEKFGISLDLLRQHIPEDGTDFGYKTLEGCYTPDKSEEGKKKLRDHLGRELKRATLKLKKTSTKVYMGPSDHEYQAAMSLYDGAGGDLEAIARKYKLSMAAMEGNPPADSRDFAEKVFAGMYTVDSTEEAIVNLRASLLLDVRVQKLGLRSQPKDIPSDPQEVHALLKLFDEHKGDLEVLSTKLLLSLKLLQGDPPKDKALFAKKTLAGDYCVDKAPTAHATFRQKLAEALGLRELALKRSPVTSTDEDFAKFVKFYEARQGDLAKIAKDSGLDYNFMTNYHGGQAPDAKQFAKNMLEGTYTKDPIEDAKVQFRVKMRKSLADVLQGRTFPEEPPVRRNRALTSVTPEDLGRFAKFYQMKKGDLKVIGEATGISQESLEKHKPADAMDFANKLFAGFYSTDMSAESRQRLRAVLREELNSVMTGLRRTSTREGPKAPDQAELANCVQVYNDCDGALAELASAFSIDLMKLKANKPTSAEDFAGKVLAGAYSL